MKKFLKRTLGLGLLAGAGYAIWKTYEAQKQTSEVEWESQPFPYPPVPKQKSSATVPAVSWMDPVDGECPPGYPVKANSKTKIFRAENSSGYISASFDRCFANSADAEAAGFREAKR